MEPAFEGLNNLIWLYSASSGVTSAVTGLSNGTACTFTVTASNAVGIGTVSAASNSVTPIHRPSVSLAASWNLLGNSVTTAITVATAFREPTKVASSGNGLPVGQPR